MYDMTLYTYLAPSKVCGGVGVFSLCDIPKGTIIWKERQKVVKVPWDKIPEWMEDNICLLYTSPSPRDLSTSRMPSSA